MTHLNSPVSTVAKIGPKNKALLEKLEIYTVEDLIYHIPFRYDDFSQVKRISEVQEGETVTIRGVLGPVTNIFTKYGKKITKSTITDFTGKIDLIWFNQHFIKKVLQTGASYSASGKVGLFDKKLTFVAPEMEESRENSLNTSRLVPIYSETQGVTSKWLRSRISDVISGLNTKHQNTNTIPELIQKKYELKEWLWAMNKIHFPDNIDQVKEARYRLAFEELFYELLKVEQRKLEWNTYQKSYTFKDLTDKTEDFIHSLPFELTESQIQSITDIKQDLLKITPMNRLLEGDVGTGKTVVAVVSAYLTYLNNYKTIYLAPTEILANQHYETFSKLLAKTNAKVALITSNTKKDLEDANIVIGTHAVLFNQELFKKTGLIVIDEQHRFGVEQRTKLLEMAKENKFTPNLLTMTATPIPRTLALTIYGDLSMSTLKTHLKTEKKVVTKVVKDVQRSEIYSWIKEKQLQTFIVCPFIETSEVEELSNVKAAQDEYEKLQKGELKGVSMGLIHGRLKSKEKQQVIDDFKSGKTKVLVATPVIEVGIDIPDATVIIIEGGERYGLASLHQLRGRVGRQSGKGFCFVFMTSYSSSAYSRLKNLEDTYDGLKLAEIDMKLRGQGDIFSTMQHGYKKYKVATLDDFVLLERAKTAAEEVFIQIDEYLDVKEKLNGLITEAVGNN